MITTEVIKIFIMQLTASIEKSSKIMLQWDVHN